MAAERPPIPAPAIRTCRGLRVVSAGMSPIVCLLTDLEERSLQLSSKDKNHGTALSLAGRMVGV